MLLLKNMNEKRFVEKLEIVMAGIKQQALFYVEFFKKRIKLYEIRRQYNLSVYELGHQFYATAKSGINDIKIFHASIEQLKELENKLISLKQELYNSQQGNQTTDNNTKQSG
jgi:hypothetical protein